MRKCTAWVSAIALLAGMTNVSFAETADADTDFGAVLAEEYASPENEYRPEVRWWMAEGSHTDETLLEDMESLSDSGFGAVEFLAMSVYGSNSETYGWGSEEWQQDSELLIRTATEAGMGFSLTSGTNWSTANLPSTYTYDGALISPDHPATSKQLSYVTEDAAAGAQVDIELKQIDYTEQNVYEQTLVAVVAVGCVDETTLDPEDITVLSGDQIAETEDGVHISWTAPDKNTSYKIFAFWMHGTAETFDPSVAYNYTLNYVDPYGMEALIDYWDNEILTDELRELITENGRGEMYMDSIEVNTMKGTGGLFWGYTYQDEFEARRGYDIIPYLPFLINTTAGRSSNGLDYLYNNLTEDGRSEDETLQKIRMDFYQTNTDLYMENVLEPLSEWLHTLNMSLRAEPSYGGNFYETSQPSKYLDDVETESLEFATQIDSYRNFTGGAHLYDKTVSSETGAVMSGLMESMFGDVTSGIYSGSFDRLNQIMYTQFAAGISRTVFHTYTSVWAPEEDLAEWPGYVGNQATKWPERIGSRQPSYLHYTEWTDMISRYQKALRQGSPRVDVGILRDDYMLNCNLSSVTYEDTEGFRAGNGLYYDISLQNAGYTYEYFSPELLTNTTDGEYDINCEDGIVQPDGPGYRALIIYQEELSLDSASRVLDWAKEQGLPVIIVEHSSELGRAYGYGGGATTMTNDGAAQRTTFSVAGVEDADAQLAQVMEELRSLDTTIVLEDEASTVEALEQLGIVPRAAFSEPNSNILTNTRLDEENGRLYTYVYNYQPGNLNMLDDTQIGESFTVSLSLEGEGKPYQLNGWTGEVTELGCYTIEDGRTSLDVTLAPGEATLIVLDLNEDGVHCVSADARTFVSEGKLYLAAEESGSYTAELSDGTTVTADIEVPEAISLDHWDLSLETWTAGETVTRTEQKEGSDHESVEYMVATDKETIEFKDLTELKSWQEMGVALSGVGTYTTVFDLPEDWTEQNGMILKLGSIYRQSAVVYVNGTRMALPLESLELDITSALAEGENTIVVEVSSNLQNSVKSETLSEMGALQNYGLVGECSVIPYTVAEIF